MAKLNGMAKGWCERTVGTQHLCMWILWLCVSLNLQLLSLSGLRLAERWSPTLS